MLQRLFEDAHGYSVIDPMTDHDQGRRDFDPDCPTFFVDWNDQPNCVSIEAGNPCELCAGA